MRLRTLRAAARRPAAADGSADRAACADRRGRARAERAHATRRRSRTRDGRRGRLRPARRRGVAARSASGRFDAPLLRDRAARRRAPRVRGRAGRARSACWWAASACAGRSSTSRGRRHGRRRAGPAVDGVRARLRAQRPLLRRLHRPQRRHAGPGVPPLAARARTAPTRARARQVLFVGQPVSRTTTAGLLLFGPDGYLYVGMGDGGSGGDPREPRAEPRHRCSARSCASTRGGAGRALPLAALEPVRRAAPGATRSTPTACATRGASRSTAGPATSTSATSARTRVEEIDFARRGEARGRNFGWSCFEGKPPLRRARAAARAPSAPVLDYGRSRRRVLGHGRRGRARPRAARRSPGATCTATSARGQPAQLPDRGRPGDRRPRARPARRRRSARSARTRAAASTSTSLDGPVYRLRAGASTGQTARA